MGGGVSRETSEPMELNIDGCELLAAAIIKEGCKEYSHGLKLLKDFNLTNNDKKNEEQLLQLECATTLICQSVKFFNSSNYAKLTSLNKNYMMSEVERMHFDDFSEFVEIKICETKRKTSKYKTRCLKELKRIKEAI